MSKAQKSPRYITPPNKLKAKVGGGGIAPERIASAQEHINNNDFDFLPHATAFIKSIKEHLEKSKTSKDSTDRTALIAPIMQLKANGGMFKYDLITQIADICLNFVEEIDNLDQDAHDVIVAHTNTITIITQNKMTGDGGTEGKALAKELQNACNRYFKKHTKKESE